MRRHMADSKATAGCRKPMPDCRVIPEGFRVKGRRKKQVARRSLLHGAEQARDDASCNAPPLWMEDGEIDLPQTSLQILLKPSEPSIQSPESRCLPAPAPSVLIDRNERWLIGFAKQFSKAIESIDRKLQGRILEAVTDIANAPVMHRGDTVKRLSGDMDGFWRYRIGDFRLVYYPDEATHTITLCDFASRGSIYD
jgi:mRNA-degrading endonuclease RelE of RelBE toxin-antitoxin system